jgi:hypothetical protein
MQSASRDMPLIANMLPGNPIYSVYLRVGDKKQWLLHYCVPAGEKIPDNPYHIQIDNGGSVTPPYPISTVIPKLILGQPFAKDIVVRALLTSQGTLQDVKTPEADSSLLSELLNALREWRFRPAQRNQNATDVEVLLVIPPRG